MEVVSPTQPRRGAAAEGGASRTRVPIQGGTDVMVELNFDRRRPDVLLNLNEVPELRGWSRENGTLRLGVGPDVRRGDARLRSPRLCRRSPRRRARSARRRSGTAGRSAATSARPRRPATRCRRCSSRTRRSRSRASRGARTVPLDEFLVGPKRNALAPDELIVAVRVAPSGAPQTFMKVGPRNAMVIAVCSLAVVADRERDELRAAFGSAGPGRGPGRVPARGGGVVSGRASSRRRARSTTCAGRRRTGGTRCACSRDRALERCLA